MGSTFIPMKTNNLCFLIGSIILVPALLVSAQQRGMKPVSISIDGQQIPLYSQSHALVIGVSDYWNIDKLPGVIQDVDAVKISLEKQDFSVTLVKNPTKDQLENAFDDFIARYGQGKDNRLLFYFAGHGHTLTTSYNEELGYLLPVDAPRPTRDNQAAFQKGCMEMAQLEIYAKRIQSKHALFLFDACFSGSLFENTRAVPDYISFNTSRPVRQFITSGMADETVPDQSVFRRQFVEALSGAADSDKDGYITGTELGSFIQKSVTNYSRNAQHPQYGKIRNPNLDKGDFVFVIRKSMTPVTPLVTPTIEEERALVQYGKLEVTTEIGGALYLDGAYLKQVNPNTVFTLKDITAGDHTIKISGEETVEKSVTITPGQILPISINKTLVNVTSGSPEMVFVQGGAFRMGSNDGEDDEKPVHPVTVGNFYMGKYEITVAQFRKFVDETSYRTDAETGDGSYIWTGSTWEKRSGVNWKCDAEGNQRPQNEYSHPVIHVTWNDANEYCNWSSRKTGKTYRLPTEAEWEYAAKGGNQSRGYNYSGSNTIGDVAWYDNNSGSKTHPVGQKQANELGLYDMTGNVYEWCSDWYGKDYYARSTSSNPKGPALDSDRVRRGGSWRYNPHYSRTSNRNYNTPVNRRYDLGFRVVLVP